MFESLTDKLQRAFSKIRSHGKLKEADIDAGLKEIKFALLEADVNFKVVKNFISVIREKSLDVRVMESLAPGQQVVKIVKDELGVLLGGKSFSLDLKSGQTNVIMLAGLQGSGKTTTSGKLAGFLKKQEYSPFLVPADLRRPAAVEQLNVVGKAVGVPVFQGVIKDSPIKTCIAAFKEADSFGYNPVILDTAGRLHVDEELMAELDSIKKELNPREILFVADAMTGQDAVNSAGVFNARLGITGTVLTKLEGDARGGAALSIVSVTGVPIKFIGVGEKYSDLEVFHPDRMVSRILGMGDVLSLIEKVESSVEKEKAKEIEKNLRKGRFTLEDFRSQLVQLKKMGPLDQILGMLPGMGQFKDALAQGVDHKSFSHMEAMLNSMTVKERMNHTLIDHSRKKRIARGSGTDISEVSRLLKQFAQMKKMMEKASKGMGNSKMLNRLMGKSGNSRF